MVSVMSQTLSWCTFDYRSKVEGVKVEGGNYTTEDSDDTVIVIAVLCGIITTFHFHAFHLASVIEGAPILHDLPLDHLWSKYR